ncbi:MAG: Spy/CpxP family protein refolding chaperone [Desulfuromonadales bacterium]
MKQKAYLVAFPTALTVVMVMFLSTFFLADAHLSFAQTAKKKSSAGAEISAVEHTEARIRELKSSLKITEAQEILWSSLTQVMQDNAKDMDAITKERGAESKTMNAVEHMKFHNQISKIHFDQQVKFIPPFEALYTSMSDEQKKITDTIFRTGKLGKHKKKS